VARQRLYYEVKARRVAGEDAERHAMSWWMWDLIGREWVPCGYALVSRAFRERMTELVAEAIENWLAARKG
jgi:hypothetical protein